MRQPWKEVAQVRVWAVAGAAAIRAMRIAIRIMPRFF
jgi:hypothetical protein